MAHCEITVVADGELEPLCAVAQEVGAALGYVRATSWGHLAYSPMVLLEQFHRIWEVLYRNFLFSLNLDLLRIGFSEADN